MAALQMFSAGLFKGPSSTSHIQSSGHLVRSEHNQIIEHIRVAPTRTSEGVFVLSAFSQSRRRRAVVVRASPFGREVS